MTWFDGVLAGGACAFAAELMAPRKGRVPTLGIGAVLALAVCANQVGGVLWAVFSGAMLVLLAGARTDAGHRSVRRHFYATVVGGAFAFAGGLAIPYLGMPGGSVALGSVASFIATVAWVFLIVSIVEVCSLVPMLAALVALAVGLSVHLPVEAFRSEAGFSLAGILVGTVLGQAIGEVCGSRLRPPAKGDILVMGYLVATATLSTFLKSLTFAGIVIPLAIATIAFITLGVHSLNDSVILRPAPRKR